MADKKPDLSGAYALKSAEELLRLYRDWATTFDSDFASDMDYRLADLVADAFAAAGGKGPVLDVGAGTGLVAERLVAIDVGPVDATDISPEMLETARAKGIYRALFLGDITDRLDVADDTYCGITCAGTFTLGHVGPDALDELIRVVRPGGWLCLSINCAHYRDAGFAEKLDALAGTINDLTLNEVAIYGPNAKGDHSGDTGFLTLFRKA
ncbi:MAG: class I SAM-dependent DNA methyltransferase [Brevirhabdus sp.]